MGKVVVETHYNVVGGSQAVEHQGLGVDGGIDELSIEGRGCHVVMVVLPMWSLIHQAR